ncbi:transposase [Nostoc sp. UIC 10630]|uniref:transposase n=1 Tax=Nostoc sp. UIC 10630 TaxID=2100146 RepID=UPI0023DE1390|nr:transposase [Nostoc sp. UIC 10630]
MRAFWLIPKSQQNTFQTTSKGRSSRYLRQEFPELMKLPSLWTHLYMFDTTGIVSTQKVLQYINDPHHG